MKKFIAIAALSLFVAGCGATTDSSNWGPMTGAYGINYKAGSNYTGNAVGVPLLSR